jgi:hypothetical protein
MTDRAWHRVQVLWGAVALALVGCGGGSSGSKPPPPPPPAAQQLGGTAAAGAPLIGTVTVKDSAGRTRGGTIDADGKYSVDVSGMTAPFMVRADGTVGGHAYTLYSAGVSSDVNGNLNVTPLTDLIVANVAHDLAAARFATGDFSVFTPAELAAKEEALRTSLVPILSSLGVQTSVDLLRMSFAADHSGLDAALDLLDVEVDTTTKVATIRNVVNGSSVQDVIGTASVTGTIDPGGAATAVSTIQDLTGKLAALTQLFATRLPTPSEVEAIGFFDTSAAFLNDGASWGLFINDFTTGGDPVGVSFRNLVVVSGLGQPEMKASIDAYDPNGNYAGTVGFFFRKDGTGVYRCIGNQRIVSVNLMTHANLDGNAMNSGYLLDVRDPQNLFAGNGVAVLSGPGITPVTYSQTISLPRFSNNLPYDSPIVWLTDAQVQQVPEYNPVYHLDVWFAGSTTPTASYDLPIQRRPIAPSQLTSAAFISVQSFSPAVSTLPTFAGGTISATFGLPPGMKAGWFFITFQDGTHYMWVDGSLAADGASGTITIPASELAGWAATKSGFCYVGGSDVYGREFETRIALF